MGFEHTGCGVNRASGYSLLQNLVFGPDNRVARVGRTNKVELPEAPNLGWCRKGLQDR